MVCKKIRKAREYPSQSKRSASLRRCIQRGTVQSRCTTQVHGDRKMHICWFAVSILRRKPWRLHPRDAQQCASTQEMTSCTSETISWSISRPQIDAIRNDNIFKLSDFVFVWLLTKPSELWKKSALNYLCVPFWCMQWSWQKPETSSNATNATYLSHPPLFQTLETPKTAQTKCSTACLVISTLSW